MSVFLSLKLPVSQIKQEARTGAGFACSYLVHRDQ